MEPPSDRPGGRGDGVASGWTIIAIDRTGPAVPAPGDGSLTPLGLADLRAMAESFAAPIETPIETGLTFEPPAGEHRLQAPVALRLSSAGFEFVDHHGHSRAAFSALDVAVMSSFIESRDIMTANIDQTLRLGDAAMGSDAFVNLVRRLVASGLLVPFDLDTSRFAEDRIRNDFTKEWGLAAKRAEQVARTLAERREAEAVRAGESRRERTKVVPVNSEGNPLLSLGLLMSYGAAFDDGRLNEFYDFVPDWADHTVPRLTGDEPPAIYLFSNYIWSHNWNVKRSTEVKAKSPGSVTVHGGPNTPKYDADIEAFFRMNPDVDVAVGGEGEETFAVMLDALKGTLGATQPDLSVLRDVPGLAYRDRDGNVVRTGKRDRMADLDVIPSPYDTGLFNSVGDVEILLMTIETNRGCPYGCTFCDWGSATQSRIRKFDLDRVFRELEWCAQHKVKTIFCADANFGIFDRDVDIARKVVELKEQYGYPKAFESSYAKNTVKHLRQIIEILVQGGILSTGTLSLQSVDEGTLDTIRRSNIRVDKYDELAVEFGKQNLPLVVELMMGLPGSTLTSFIGDLQQCIDREVKARVNPTEVLMNSPMNSPDYRAENEIATLRPVQHDWSEENGKRKKALIISTSTFTRAEYDQMERYRRAFIMCENYAVLRQVSRFVRHETGLAEMQFYARLADDAVQRLGRWPAIEFMFTAGVNSMIPPVSWRVFVDEIGEYLVTEIGMDDDSALRTVLEVQHAVLPARDRVFPYVVELEHDFAAWHRTLLDVKRGGHTIDWRDDVPPLRSFGPASFEVEDPQSVSALGLGVPLFYDTDSDWELKSPVARPMRFRHTLHA